jgi:hypothetical protein
VLAGVPLELVSCAVQHDIQITLYSAQMARAAGEAARRLGKPASACRSKSKRA